MSRLVIVALFAALLGCVAFAYQSLGGYSCGTTNFSCQYNKMAKTVRRLY
jgi:hypothetical protein